MSGVFKKELIGRLKAITELVENDHVSQYAETVDYEPIEGKNGEVIRHVPTDYGVSFMFKDRQSGHDVTVTIKTKLEQV